MSDEKRLATRRSKLSPAKQALLEKRLRGDLSELRDEPTSWLIPRRLDQNLFPLSFAQERFWFLEYLDPGNPVNNRPMALRLKGPLSVPALEHSLSGILRRHQVLRAGFSSVEGRPVQVITEPSPLSLPVVNLGEIPPAERERHARRLAAAEVRRPFVLSQGPLLRASLLRMDNEEHVLVLVAHHIVFDGWSARVLVKELGAVYESFAHGAPWPLPELAIQYADFAHWQRQRVQGEALEAQLAYWKEKLAAPLPLLPLPTDRPRPAMQTHRGARQILTISSSLLKSLTDLGRREGATLFMTLLAVFQTLLHRYTGQDDLIVGSPVAGRTHVETEKLIGFFVNTLVLRSDLSGNPSFRELLRRVREVALDAYAHQDVPFEKLVEELQPKRDPGRTPLFQVLFNLENVPPSAVKTHNLDIEEIELDSGTARFDLSMELVEKHGGLSCFLQYNSDLFDATTIARMAGHFRTLLEGIATDPDRHLGDLPLLTEEERHLLLVQWNATQADYPEDLCFHQLFEAQVERTPDAIAVVFEDRQLTYRALNCRANQLAHYLQKLDVGPEVLVGLYVERSLEMVVAVLGILKAGGAYVPLDPAYPALWIDRVLQDAQTPVLLTQEHLRTELSRYGAQVVCLDADWPAISAESERNPRNDIDPRNATYVIFTSGSTGRPKGVVVEHRSVLNFMTGLHKAVHADVPRHPEQLRIGLNTPLTFDASVKDLVQALNGHTLYILPSEVRADGEALLAYVRRHELDVLDCTPSHLELILAAGMLQMQGPMPEMVLVGGEAIAESTWQVLVQASGIAFYNLYGPTECTVVATLGHIQPANRRPTIGRPLANTQIYLLDPQLEPVPVGVRGELCIGGLGVSRGYLRRPSLTAERFIPDPFSDQPGARLYRTGDLARYLPDGQIEFLGRLDHQVKIRGYRVELGEIETTLSQHPEVRDAVAMVREDTPAGRRLVAYVVPVQPESSPTTSELRRYLKQTLPDHMVPSAFVSLPALPLMPNGKVDRRALPVPGTLRPDLGEAFVAPRTPVEKVLAGIWAEVLALEQIGIHDEFFDLGGHSLLATQIVSRVRQTFQVELPLRRLFETPTVADLAARVETLSWAASTLQRSPGDTADDYEEGTL
jgi:amino acid adenylation domain-containing protein